jgi:hypothetical protein
MVPPGVNQPAFFRTTGLGSWAWDVFKAVRARPSVWTNLPASSAAIARTCESGSEARCCNAGSSTWSAPGAHVSPFAPVAGQSVERGGPDPGVGIVGHGDELAHGVGVDQVVQETAARAR